VRTFVTSFLLQAAAAPKPAEQEADPIHG
jgi:hypothetical protein